MALFPWLRPDKPEPTPAPQPVDTPAATPWLKVWWTLRGVNMRAIWPALLTVPVIVFFALSGMVAWLWLLMRGAVSFVKSLFK